MFLWYVQTEVTSTKGEYICRSFRILTRTPCLAQDSNLGSGTYWNWVANMTEKPDSFSGERCTKQNVIICYFHCKLSELLSMMKCPVLPMCCLIKSSLHLYHHTGSINFTYFNISMSSTVTDYKKAPVLKV